MTTCTLATDYTLPHADQQVTVLRLEQGQGQPTHDRLIEEVPVAMVYNGISHAVLLASPTHLEDFALGFSLSEGILQQAGELYDLDVQTGPQGIAINMDIASARFSALKERRRTLAGRTGCGLCGVDNLDAVSRDIAPLPDLPTLPLSAVAQATEQFRNWQPLHQQTGAAHGAAFCQTNGNITLAREDVGRHNALDKLVGALRRQQVDTRGGFVLVSSRASYEMVQKTAMAGIGTLVAVSAPTAYATRLAHETGLLLAGFARPGRLTIYSQPDRLINDFTHGT